MSLTDVAVLLGGVSRTRAVEIVNRPTFPAPIGAVGGGRMRIWDREEVLAWIREHRPHQRED